MPVPPPRPNVAAMSGYVPGEQAAVGEVGGRRVVKLNTNENPYPPPPQVMAAVAAVSADALRRYPEPSARAFRAAAADHHGVTPEQVICGNGSDDLLTVLIRTFVPDGGAIAYPAPTYSLYPTLAQIQDARAVEVPWGERWTLPADELAEVGADLTVVVNPNAPSGTLVPAAELADLAGRLRGPLLIDEAYADFAGCDCVGLLRDHANVVVSRTMSKGYSLAGLRFGYALGHPDVVRQLNKVRDSYNCDALAQAAATAALRHADVAAESWARVRAERERLAGRLAGLGFGVLPSRANFLLAAVPAGADAGDLYRRLKAAGVLVRHWDQPGLADKLRVSVGTPGDTDALLDALRPLLADAAA